jgi:Cysteine-rich secretory protein family
MHRVLGLLVGLALALATVGGAAQTAPDGEELAFLGLINDYRAGLGLGQLVLSPTLTAAAEYHSLDMATSGVFSHTLSDGTDPGQNIANHGYTDPTWGENIAAGMETAQEAFVAWQNSPGHDANMRRPDFGAIGIGRAYVEGSPRGWYWTTVFGGSPDALVVAEQPAVDPSTVPAPVAEPVTYQAVQTVPTDAAAQTVPLEAAQPSTISADGGVVQTSAGSGGDAAADASGGSVTVGGTETDGANDE